MSESDGRVATPRTATQRDVARLAHVDRATVSRALDPDRRHLLTPETVRRVLEAADALHYRPNTLAQGLRRQRSNIVSLSVPRALREQSSDFIEGVEDRLGRAGVALVVNFGDDGRLLRASNGLLDGSIVLVPDARTLDRASFAHPAVAVGFEHEQGLDVVIDQAHGVARAVDHLHRLGHRRLALLAEPPSTPLGQRFREDFAAAVDRLPGEVTALYATFIPKRPSSAPEACQGLLTRPDRPTAIFVTDGGAAAGCYGAARMTGFRVPHDVSIIGYGDPAAAPYLVPPLTTISAPTRLAGRRAAELLLAAIDGDSSMTVSLEPHLLQRGSTAEHL
ncbi:LacI family transcriptional regulator [Herbiconiux sp. CPCC 203407]|uniref:LacI family transcriptional regulator n=1 Tax=Herbiconiux oxytropis TaxID=2970915 RepID=A0AA41XHH7_9MICO|nr:LacI family DNA-binding transcriptional regulator [Herbiconiux oxytropis]MCS5722932.1 LacI family transcriptional regulator [Herbiconiux oxytropis]MCS5725808.1 LacI family transcriptional regulator [Herbiconiux oxytropis]